MRENGNKIDKRKWFRLACLFGVSIFFFRLENGNDENENVDDKLNSVECAMEKLRCASAKTYQIFMPLSVVVVVME
jgi:hypothetical protein